MAENVTDVRNLIFSKSFLKIVLLFIRKNHTSGAVVAGTIVAAPLIFLTGQHAAIPAGYTNVTTVKIDTEL